ncbi:MAG: hypothetical protein ACREBH_02685 [Candidatus Micrarchaeaceae archaeon]
MIFVGVSLFAAIKLYSDSSISNKSVMISKSRDAVLPRSHYSEYDMAGVALSTRKANDSVFILKGLPVRLNEIPPVSVSTGNMHYRGTRFKYLGAGVIHNNMIDIDGKADSCNSFAARMLYDEYMEYGKLSLRKSDSHARFLARNDAVCVAHVSLKHLESGKELCLVSFNAVEGKILNAKRLLFTRGGALLLALSANKTARVIDC